MKIVDRLYLGKIMKTIIIDSFCFINEIKEHKINKKNLLNLIKKIPLNSVKDNSAHINHSDWNLPRDNERRQYLELFYEIVRPYMDTMMKKLHSSEWDIQNGWFQQYKTNDKHTWHSHPYTNFSNIYFLEMPEKQMQTQFFDMITEKIITFNVKEGDLLTFPAFMIHRSDEIKNKKRKTIISFNSNFIRK